MCEISPMKRLSLTLCDSEMVMASTRKRMPAAKSLHNSGFLIYTRVFTQSEGEPQSSKIYT